MSTLDESDLYIRAREFGTRVHAECNHIYDGNKPYAYHLQMVSNAADFFALRCGLSVHEHLMACSAAWAHDAIEDARQTYNDVRKALGVEVAELAYALTNEKGKSRSERANDKYYAGIRALPLAVYLKGCDRLANVSHGAAQTPVSRMVSMYAKEQVEFRAKLGVIRDENHPYEPLFDAIDEIFYDVLVDTHE